jgi:hypothetical protein
MRSKAHRSLVSTVRRRRWKFVQGGVLLIMFAAVVQLLGLSQQDKTAPAPVPPPVTTAVPSQANPTSNPASAQMAGSPQDRRADAASSALLKLATELKAAVDKSTKDTLSVGVIRKADEIERMARGMKDKYRASAATN